MLKAYLSVKASPLSAFVISKAHIVAQKPCGRQLNAKVCGNRSAIFVFYFFRQPKYLENGFSAHRGCSTKMIHTSAQVLLIRSVFIAVHQSYARL